MWFIRTLNLDFLKQKKRSDCRISSSTHYLVWWSIISRKNINSQQHKIVNFPLQDVFIPFSQLNRKFYWSARKLSSQLLKSHNLYENKILLHTEKNLCFEPTCVSLSTSFFIHFVWSFFFRILGISGYTNWLIYIRLRHIFKDKNMFYLT